MENILQWNVNGFFSRLPYLQKLLADYTPIVIALQETKLNNQTVYLKNYKIYRKDRDSKGGGVLLAIHNLLPSLGLHINSNLEIVACQVYFQGKKLSIASIYIPCDTNLVDNELEDVLNQMNGEKLILGDFNAKHDLWGSNVNDQRGDTIAEFILYNNLSVLNNGSPTYCRINDNYYSNLDLSLISIDIVHDFQWETCEFLFESDHFPIIIKYKCERMYEKVNKKWILKRANWEIYKNNVNIPNIELIEDTQEIKRVGKSVCKAIIDAANKAVPKTKGIVTIKYNTCWWNQDCEDAVKAKKHSLNVYRKNPTIQNLIMFKKNKAKVRKIIKDSKKNSWRTYVGQINRFTSLRDIWNIIRSIERKNISIPKIILREGNLIISDPKELANKFIDFFSKVSSDDNYSEDFLLHKTEMEFVEHDFSSDNMEDYNALFTMEELKRSVMASKSSTPGEDEVHYDFIKNLNDEELGKLLIYYNKLWIHEILYDEWNEVVVPILKPGKDPHIISSYRPIALTSCLSKTMQRMVNERLCKVLESKKKMNKKQSGFRKCHSTYDALTRLETNIRETYLRNEYLIVVSLDIKKAYDMVWNFGLLMKIKDINIKGRLAKYIKNFLENRKVKVKIGNTFSDSCNIVNGTPQGSVISPTLFNIMINDLFDKCDYIEYALYADDGLMILRTNDLEEGLENMQLDIQKIEEWSDTWGLNFSVEKTKCTIFTKRPVNNPTVLRMSNQDIHYVERMKYLGVIFDKTLTWKYHIDELKASCMKRLILLKNVSRKSWGADRKTLILMYKSLIQSKINYASFLFDSAAECHLKKLDRIQYEGIRICTGAMRCTRTDYLEVESNILPLKYQRKLIGLNYFGRSITIRDHIMREVYNEYYTFQFYLIRPHPLPFIAYIKEMYTSLGISLDDLQCITMKDIFMETKVQVKTNLKLNIRKEENPQVFRSLYHELCCEVYENYLDIYTDGSKKNDLVSYAFWAGNNYDECGRLRNKCSIFTAELYAIYKALKYINNNLEFNRFVIFCDSSGALQALQQMYNRNYLVIKIKKVIKLIENDGKEIIMEWIPSHVGIKGNEKADEIAKGALNRNTYNNIKLSYEDYKHIMKNEIMKQWQEEWDQYNSYLHDIKPKIGNWESSYRKDRREEVVMCRLRLGCVLIDNKHIFDRSEPPICDLCNVRLNSRHMILSCPKYVNYRNNLFSYIRENNLIFNMMTILNDSFPAHLLISFLKSGKIIDYL